MVYLFSGWAHVSAIPAAVLDDKLEQPVEASHAPVLGIGGMVFVVLEIMLVIAMDLETLQRQRQPLKRNLIDMLSRLRSLIDRRHM